MHSTHEGEKSHDEMHQLIDTAKGSKGLVNIFNFISPPFMIEVYSFYEIL